MGEINRRFSHLITMRRMPTLYDSDLIIMSNQDTNFRGISVYCKQTS